MRGLLRLFFRILLVMVIVLYMLKTKSVGQDNVIASRLMAKKARRSSNQNDQDKDIPSSFKQSFGPLNLERFQLADGQLAGDEMFIWYAFYDTRDSLGPRIRFLANAVCKGFEKGDVKIIFEDGVTLALEWAEVLGLSGCAGDKGDHCRLQEMEFSTIIFRGRAPDKITIRRKTNQVTVKLHRIPAEYKDAINTCVSNSLFWYNDWPRLFLFFESWRRNKVDKILLHIHSASKEVMQVINHYVKQGLVEVRPFPLMPFSTQYNPNMHIWYAAQHLITFFCSIWSDSKYTTMNDVDEILYVRNRSETLLDVVRRLMDPLKHPDMGAIQLKHHALGFPGGITSQPWDFEVFKRFTFVKQAITYSRKRAGKYIYQTQHAKRPWIHAMKAFYGNKRGQQAGTNEVIYLHMRNNNINVSGRQQLFPDFKMFDDQAILEMGSTIEEIFQGQAPPFLALKTQQMLLDCLKRTLTEIPGEDCKKPTGPICYESLKDQDQWLYAVPTKDSHFIPL